MSKYSLEREMLKIYSNLQNQQEQGVETDYEIHIDGMAVVPRTSNLENFDRYKSQLDADSVNILVKVYHGKARTCYKFKFKTDYAKKLEDTEKNRMTNFSLKEEILKANSSGQFLNFKYKELKKKNSKLKDRIAQLQEQNQELLKSTENNTVLTTLTGAVSTFMGDKLNPGSLNGVDGKQIGKEETDLLNMYAYMKSTLTKQELQALFGIIAGLGTNKNLIEQTREFLADKLPKNPSDEKAA